MKSIHVTVGSFVSFISALAPRLANAENWQETFVPITAPFLDESTVSTWESPIGFVYHYGSVGPHDGDPVLFFGGGQPSRHQGLLIAAPYMTMVEQLGLRIITLERPASGLTTLTSSATISSIVDDAVMLMEDLGYSRFAVFASSIGGPYGDNILLRYPNRVSRLVSWSGVRGGNQGWTWSSGFCGAVEPLEPLAFLPFFEPIAQDPSAWDDFFVGPEGQEINDVVDSIPDWRDVAWTPFVADAYLAHRGSAVSLEFYRSCVEEPTWGADPQLATSPVYVYTADTDVVPIGDGNWRLQLFPNTIHRHYSTGGHFVGVRHFGQVLLDLAGIDKTILCKAVGGGAYKTVIRNAEAAAEILANGGFYDICAWRGTPGE